MITQNYQKHNNLSQIKDIYEKIEDKDLNKKVKYIQKYRKSNGFFHFMIIYFLITPDFPIFMCLISNK